MVIILFVSLIILSAFFSASETALLSLNEYQLKRMGARNASASSKIVNLLSHPRSLIMSILTGNTLVNTAASSCATIVSVSIFGAKGIAVAIGFMLFILLIFGEVTPKRAAYIFAERFSLFAVYPLEIIVTILSPVRKVLYIITDTIIKNIGIVEQKESSEFTREEIKSLIKIGHRDGVVKDTEKHLIYGIFAFKGQHAKDIMTPKINIKALDFDMPHEQILEYIKNARHSRLPVYRDSLDNIIGIVYAKDMLFNPNANLKDFIKETHFIPESEYVDRILSDLQKITLQMAIVTDEYGVTTGLVTMEDILDKISGEITEGLKEEPHLISAVSDGVYRVSGMLKITEANRKLSLNLKSDDVETMGGFVSLIMQKIPKENEEILYKGIKFKVMKIEKNRIKEILITKK